MRSVGECRPVVDFLQVRSWIRACIALCLAATLAPAAIAGAAEAPADTAGFAAELAQFHADNELDAEEAAARAETAWQEWLAATAS